MSKSGEAQQGEARPPGALERPLISAAALPHIAALHAYTPGIQPTEPGWVKLNTNESPYPPSPAVAEAVKREVGTDGASLRLYPNPASAPLRAAIAALHGITAAGVCVGNGSDDILNLLVRVCCGPDAEAGYTLPSYSLYPVLLGIQNGAAEVIPFDRTMQLPLDRIAQSKAPLFILTSPNAPTGIGFSRAEIAKAAAACSGLFVADEAYAPFAAEDAVPLLAEHRNLVVVRTLSKSYALAGIRVGYALADPEVIGWLDRVRDSYNVNRLSQAAALAAIQDQAYHRKIVDILRATRDRVQREWREQRGWFTYPSQANFIFTEPRNGRGETGPAVAKSAYEFLLSRKILIRYFPNHALTASFLRVSVGTDDEMTRLNSALDAWLNQSHAA
jgi:histidinol-phosphate aminotransferase